MFCYCDLKRTEILARIEEGNLNPEFDGELVSPTNKELDDIPDLQRADIVPAGPEVPDPPGLQVPEPPGLEVLDTAGLKVPDPPGPAVPDPHGPADPDPPGPADADPPRPEDPDLGLGAQEYNAYHLESRSGLFTVEDQMPGTQLLNLQPYWQDRCVLEPEVIIEEQACNQFHGPGQHFLAALDIGHDRSLQEEASQVPFQEFPSWYDKDQDLSTLDIQGFDMSCSIEVPPQGLSKSLDETADFMRGAHMAPHSSEIDLSDAHERCTEKDAWQLSVRQLARAIQRHERALSLLLEEHARRHQQLSFLSGPAGTGRGRGRGRLQQARKHHDTLW
ncbi:hypothetical protein PYW07_000038 [Mythimna separata]|uniref:Uncharacterized protein n=1 Tax=Mythimna separata TaxID=271217 RepID=A0AAD8E192_MYTSE|nr:hypothetical protein PYW07_000038 [Mythimna separata]